MSEQQKNSVYKGRLLKHRIGICLSTIAMFVGLFFLAWILMTLFVRGFGSISLDVFTKSTPPADEPGGLWNAIFGSLVIVAAATFIATPIGILAGIYLSEFGDRKWFGELTRFVADIMLSAPSIVIGMFIFIAYVAQVKHHSGWAGSIALSLIAIPVVMRTTDNMLALVPTSLREAAFALGAPRWKVAIFIRLKAVRAGILTGILLAVARISGETAPLMYTAMSNQFFNSDMNKPMANLPMVISNFAMTPYEDLKGLAWAGALILTFGVLALNILSRTVFAQKNQH